MSKITFQPVRLLGDVSAGWYRRRAGAGRMAPPVSTRISANMKCAQRHSSPHVHMVGPAVGATQSGSLRAVDKILDEHCGHRRALAGGPSHATDGMRLGALT